MISVLEILIMTLNFLTRGGEKPPIAKSSRVAPVAAAAPAFAPMNARAHRTSPTHGVPEILLSFMNCWIEENILDDVDEIQC